MARSKSTYNPIGTTYADVAAFFGVSRDHVRQSWVPAGMPGKSGDYDMRKIYRWKIQRDKDAEHERSPAAERKREADARKAHAEAERRERMNKIEAGEFVSLSEVEQQISEIIPALRQRLEKVSNIVRPKIPAKYELELVAEIDWAVQTELAGVSKDLKTAFARVRKAFKEEHDADVAS